MLGLGQERIVGVLEVPGDSQEASNLATCHVCLSVVTWTRNFSTSSWSLPCLEHYSWVQGIEMLFESGEYQDKARHKDLETSK